MDSKLTSPFPHRLRPTPSAPEGPSAPAKNQNATIRGTDHIPKAVSCHRTPKSHRPVSAPAFKPSAIRYQSSVLRRAAAPAFSLVELLVVIAIIAILTSFTIVAFQGTSGAKGYRGGLDSFLSALDLAKQTAETVDVNVYVGFPSNDFKGSTAEVPHSHFILFRDMTFDELNDPKRDKSLPPFVPLSKWIKLPQGIVVDLSTMDFEETRLDEDYHLALPRLEGKDVPNMRLIQYNRHGSVVNRPSEDKKLFVLFGEGSYDGRKATVFGKNSANLTVSRLTGQWSKSNDK